MTSAVAPPRIALVGLGYWGPKLLRNLVSVVGPGNVVAVDQSPERVAVACRSFPGVSGALSLEQVLEDPSISAVILATPLSTHAALGRLALDSGRHVLVEKPLAASLEESLDLVSRAENMGLTLMVGHTFLFSPRIEKVTDLVRQGRVGRVKYVASNRLNLGLHRHDANVIWDLAPHEFSILSHILGEFPCTIQTMAPQLDADQRPEVAFISAAFPSGAIASLTVSWLAPRKIRTTMVVGDERMILYDDDNAEEPIKIYDKGIINPDEASYASHQMTYRYGDTVAPYVPATEPLANEIQHFVDCIQSGAICRSDGWFGIAVVEALEAADRSWRAGGRPVALGGIARGEAVPQQRNSPHGVVNGPITAAKIPAPAELAEG